MKAVFRSRFQSKRIWYFYYNLLSFCLFFIFRKKEVCFFNITTCWIISFYIPLIKNIRLYFRYKACTKSSKMSDGYSGQLGSQSCSNINLDVDKSNEQADCSSSSKRYLTYIYCLVFWNFGLCVAIFGPTLLDLACQTSSSLSAMSILYFMQNFTSLIGVFVSGVVLRNNRITVVNLLLVCTLLMPLCVALMPMSKNILFLALVMILLGFNMGCVDNVANLAIMKLHSNNVSPYIQTMHFFYGIGAFIVSFNIYFLKMYIYIYMKYSQFLSILDASDSEVFSEF